MAKLGNMVYRGCDILLSFCFFARKVVVGHRWRDTANIYVAQYCPAMLLVIGPNVVPSAAR